MSSSQLDVIILAAGKGTRMRSSLPKVLHCVAAKPLLQHVIDSVEALQPQNIFVVVGHQKERIQSAIQNSSIQWIEQQQQLGTGHAVQQVAPHLNSQAQPEHRTLIVTADVPLIQTETLAHFVECLDVFSLAVLSAKVDNPFGLGRILRDEVNNLAAIVEEKDASAAQRTIQEINSGIICARTDLLLSCLQQLDNNNAQQEFYLTDIIELAYKQDALITADCIADSSEIEGINNRAQLARVERLYQRRQANKWMAAGVTLQDPERFDVRGEVSIGRDTVIDVNAVIIGPTTIGDNVHIEANCVIDSCVIEEGSHIHSHSVLEHAHIEQNAQIGPFARLRPGTHLAKNTKIGNFVEIKNARLGSGAKANHLSYVGDATVGENTNIGAGVITCNYDGANKHKTEIGNNVFVGSDCQLVAPVTIADDATIGAGSTITNDVEAKQLAVSRGKQRNINDWSRPKKDKKR